jgi:hypothetical protein
MRSGSQRERGRLLYRGTVEWGLFRQVVTQLVAGWKGWAAIVTVRGSEACAQRDVAGAAAGGGVSYSELMEDRLQTPCCGSCAWIAEPPAWLDAARLTP